MLLQQDYFSISLFVISGIVSYWSWSKTQRKQFYSDTPWLFPLGIFVWGDGLILGPFWMVIAVLSWWVGWSFNYEVLFAFFIIFRSFFEVMYWILHQSSDRDYEPPVFRHFPNLNAREAAILYQLFHMCVVVLGSYYLWQVA